MQTTPLNWFTSAVSALQWPVVVISAFVLGRYVSRLETRVLMAERSVKDLVTRHMPHIHTALGEIKSSLDVLTGIITGRR